ncbi:hypothetical protein F5Y06DRAFT_266249 [Hypoxylon sp. FL0890]|nr:hypothetical protein F5Y06DRAFT_266249 [Hypoxylon sp. FL0890]
MSAAGVFLSSSPSSARIDSYALSSSPNLPSLNEIFTNTSKKPALRSGSHATPIPNNVRASFTSAASLLREAPEIDIETEKITRSPPRKANPSTAKTKNAPKSVIGVPAQAPILIESSPTDKPWQKFKNKKPTSQSEKQPAPKSRVTKPSTKGKAREKTETVSRHFAVKECAVKHAEKRSDHETTSHELEGQAMSGPSRSEPAMRRRSDWTPPPANDPIAAGPGSDNQELLSSIERGPKSKDVFQTLVDDYGRKATLPSVASNRLQQVDILTKGKLIELVSTSKEVDHRSREVSPPRAVNMKKKTRTITELATAPYMLPTNPELDLAGPATQESLLDYFDSDGAVKALVEHQTAVMSQKREKAKESKAPAKPKRKRKSGTVNNPILLSPSSALKQSSNQDFVFGTSSQLVREESPTTLRDLQLAIQASNQVDSDPFAESDSQGLWHAGARDTDGELMKADDVEIVDNLPSLPGVRQAAQTLHEEYVDINDVLRSSGADESAAQALQLNSHSFQSQAASGAQLPQIDVQEDKGSQGTAGENNPQPDFKSLSDAQLSRQIAAYGFKPVKKRQAMIALLDQCWNSKSSGTSITQSKAISTSSSMNVPKRKQQAAITEPENPPKRRGRPKKDSTTETPSMKTLALKETSPKRPRGRPKKDAPKPVEIADSDLDNSVASASSKASSPDRDRIFSSPPAIDLSNSVEVNMSLTLSPTDQQADLFKHITKAVTSASRSTDPSQPSWHEKMLLYDPIVLEDLAAWLNAGALSGAGYDGEVSPFDVKEWCESKSVICLWRQNIRGKERKRY